MWAYTFKLRVAGPLLPARLLRLEAQLFRDGLMIWGLVLKPDRVVCVFHVEDRARCDLTP